MKLPLIRRWNFTLTAAWFVGFRLYDPDRPFFDKAWIIADLEKIQ